MENYPRLAVTDNNIKAGLILCCVLLFSGCATVVGKDDVDPGHSHDGAWLAEIEKTPHYQRAGSWYLRCNDISGEFGFIVEDSVLRFNFLGKNHETFVARGGNFYLEVKSDYVAKESPSSDVALSNGEVTYVFKGNLATNSAKGIIVIAIGGLADRGCRSSMVFSKVTNTEA